MGHPYGAFPTKREVVILAVLLVFLFATFTRKGRNGFDEEALRRHSDEFPSSIDEEGTMVNENGSGGDKIDAEPGAGDGGRGWNRTEDDRWLWGDGGLVADEPRELDTRLTWGTVGTVPQSRILAHVPGWTIFDDLYFMKGVIYIVTDEPSMIPEVQLMYSKGLYIENGPAAQAARLPDEDDIKVISTKEAKTLFGLGAQKLDGVNVFINDPPQFITHYYHWSAELWFGLWRTYSSLDPFITSSGNTTLPPFRRLIFNHLDTVHWRDYASMNELVTRSTIPGLTMEFKDDWNDRTSMSTPFVLDRAILLDRSSAMLSYNYARYQRTAGSAFALPGNSANWWMTMRKNVLEMVAGFDVDVGGGTLSTPVITYISRQAWGRRMLRPEDHERLVIALERLRDEHGYEVHIVSPERMTREEQIKLAARTTILMGVHGNGLTSLLWMKPSLRSTVMEFFIPGGFAHDYEYTTRAMGMVHYGFWGSEYFTSPGLPTPQYPPGFQGNSIPIDADVVTRLCVERLSLSIEVDD